MQETKEDIVDYVVGDVFVWEGGRGEEYILAQVTFTEMSLISITRGSRWEDPVEVLGIYPTKVEWWDITGGESFIKVRDSE